ncbi:hypothetical protein [Mesorhizobium sp. 128a]
MRQQPAAEAGFVFSGHAEAKAPLFAQSNIGGTARSCVVPDISPPKEIGSFGPPIMPATPAIGESRRDI